MVVDPSPKTRGLGGFIDVKMFPVDRDKCFQTQAAENRPGGAVAQRGCAERPSWGAGSGHGIKSGGASEEEEDYEDEEDVGEGGEEDERLVDREGDCTISVSNRFKSSGQPCTADQIDNGRLKQHEASGVNSDVNHLQGKAIQFQNAFPLTAIYGDGYYTQVVNCSEVSAQRRMDMVVIDNGSGSTLRKEAPLCESVRSILSDPFTGELMDDAVIFPCGHSFGAGGLQHSLQKKACYTCSLPISEDSAHRNLTLRAAVAAFRREEYANCSSKRKRDRFEEKADFCDANHMDSPSSRSFLFPFAVADRVMIVGNKRTPQRFVGREAIITGQCLNGWFVVRTLDNAESVKLQYRSLAKVAEEGSSNPMTKEVGSKR